MIKENVEFLCIQETKLSYVDERLACVMWGNKDCGLVYSGSDGASGGLCCLWNSSVFRRTELWGEKGVLGVSGWWKGVLVNIVNVYAPCDVEGKKELWRVLEEKMRGKEDEKWCLCGDFNVVRNDSERRGKARAGRRMEMKDFNDFINGMELVDLSLERRKFTWYRDNGQCCSRIDRFLLSSAWSAT